MQPVQELLERTRARWRRLVWLRTMCRAALAAALVLACVAVAGFIAGFGLLEHRPWARTLAIVLGIISLLNPLLGTLLGIYTLWVLLPSTSEEEDRQIARAA